MVDQKSSPLRERTRQAVRREIADAALRLFVSRGYAETTIDDIAAAVGTSQRSVFRYFATKEDIAVGKFDLGMQGVLDALDDGPPDESVWQSLRRVFGRGDMMAREDDAALLRMVFDTPALLSVYLQKLHGLEDEIVTALRSREGTKAGHPPNGDVVLWAQVAAAVGCFVAAQRVAVITDHIDDLPTLVDQAMSAVTPTTEDRRQRLA